MLSKGQELQRTLWEANRAGALTPGAVSIDGAHIKASAKLSRKIKQEVPAAAARYREELAAEINADRESHGKKPFDDDDEPPRPTGKKGDNTSKKKLARRKKAGFKTVAKSTTEPDCGMFVKGKAVSCPFVSSLLCGLPGHFPSSPLFDRLAVVF